MADPNQTSRQVDPILAAKAEAYGLMIAAKANNGQWTCHQFADAPAASLARATCEHEGFEARPASAEYPNTVAIRSRR
jgi:hypothetical protein